MKSDTGMMGVKAKIMGTRQQGKSNMKSDPKQAITQNKYKGKK